jgi:LuxR family maltose regulon positive regulatory protein
MHSLARVLVVRGELDEAEAVLRRGHQSALDANGRQLPVAGMILIGLAGLAHERGESSRAEQLVREGIDLVKQWGLLGTTEGYLLLASICLSERRTEEAQEAIATAETLARDFDATTLDDVLVSLYRLRLDLETGNVQAVESWLESTARPDGMRDLRASYDIAEMTELARARALLGINRPAEALEAANQVGEQAGLLERHGRVLAANLVTALSYESMGRAEHAADYLNRTMPLAERERYVASFTTFGSPMAALLYRTSNQGLSSEYAARLLAAFPTDDQSTAFRRIAPEGMEPLSERELEVLRLVARGFPNKEVADRMCISVRTVKWHTTNIYGKLRASNRTQAVAIGRSIGILPQP